jgi:O-antigen ligase
MAFVLRKEDFRLGALSKLLIIFLLYSALSFYFSLNADASLYPALRFLTALFLTLALIFYLKDIETLVKALVVIFVLAGIHAGIGILQQIIPSLLYQPNRLSFASTSLFGNPNFFSGYLAIHIPIGMYLIFQSRDTTFKILFGGLLLMILVALGFSGSPGGQLVAGVQVLGMIVYYLAKQESRQIKFISYGLLLTLGIYIGLVQILNQYPGSEEMTASLIRRPWVWEHMENRFMYWTGAWTLFKENWLLGTGLWTFKELYPQTGLKYTPPHVHNMYLQTATETGLIGFSLLLACLSVLGLTIIRIFKNGKTKLLELNIYIAFSLFGFLLHNFIEYNWLGSNFIYFFVFLVISVELISRDTQDNKQSSSMPGLKGVWPKAVTLTLALGALTVLQYYRYDRIVSHDVLMSQTVEEVLSNAERAKDICSRCGRPHYLSGIIYLEQFHLSKNDQDLIQAEKEFEEAIERNPLGLGTYLKLAQIKSLQSNFEEAKSFYERAMDDSRYRLSALAELENIEKIKADQGL